jgi:hypothetical protein
MCYGLPVLYVSLDMMYPDHQNHLCVSSHLLLRSTHPEAWWGYFRTLKAKKHWTALKINWSPFHTHTHTHTQWQAHTLCAYWLHATSWKGWRLPRRMFPDAKKFEMSVGFCGVESENNIVPWCQLVWQIINEVLREPDALGSISSLYMKLTCSSDASVPFQYTAERHS